MGEGAERLRSRAEFVFNLPLATKRLIDDACRVVLADLSMQGMSGIRLLDHARVAQRRSSG